MPGATAPRLFDNAPAEVDSSEFSDDIGRSVEDSVGYEPTTAVAARDFLVYESLNFSSCLKTTLLDEIRSPDPSDPSDSLPAGTTAGNISAMRLPFSTMGDRSVSLRLTVAIHDQAASVTQYVDFLEAVKGRVGVQVVLFSTSAAPFAAADEEGYITDILGRLSRI